MSDLGDWMKTWADWLSERPHLWLSLSLMGLLVVLRWRRKVWPFEGEVIELLAYGSASHSAALMLKHAWSLPADSSDIWGPVIGGFVFGYAAVKGAWKVLMPKTVDPVPVVDLTLQPPPPGA